MMELHIYRELGGEIIDVMAQVLFWGVLNEHTVTEVFHVHSDGPNKIIAGVAYVDKDHQDVSRYLAITSAANGGHGVFITSIGEEDAS